MFKAQRIEALDRRRRQGWIKILPLFIIFTLFWQSLCFAFLYELPIQDKEAISKLSNDKLIDTYIDVMVEFQAVNAFYQNAGFTPKEYKQYKTFLRYRIDLIREMQKRKLEIPKIDP